MVDSLQTRIFGKVDGQFVHASYTHSKQRISSKLWWMMGKLNIHIKATEQQTFHTQLEEETFHKIFEEETFHKMIEEETFNKLFEDEKKKKKSGPIAATSISIWR